MSSLYPVWWDTTITIYNKYENTSTNVITWYGTVIPLCFWKYVGDSINQTLTQEDKYDTICRIPENPLYVPNYLWKDLSELDKASHFTVNLDDIIIKGYVTDTINEYTAGKRSTDIIDKYKKLQGCITVKEFAIDTGEGRCLPHYRIYGI